MARGAGGAQRRRPARAEHVAGELPGREALAALRLGVGGMVERERAVLDRPGALGLTLAYHVPRNEALAHLDPRAADAAGRWSRYASSWTAANHVRAAAALAAAAALTVGLRAG